MTPPYLLRAYLSSRQSTTTGTMGLLPFLPSTSSSSCSSSHSTFPLFSCRNTLLVAAFMILVVVTVQILLLAAFHLCHSLFVVAQSGTAISSRSFLSHLSFPLTPPPASVPVNIHRLARLASRLHTGLPLVVAAVGGSNMAGNAIEPWRGGSGNGTLVDLVVEWMNEKFPVDQDVALQELQLQRQMGGGKEWLMGTPAECDYFNETTSLRHRAENRAVGGTRSSMASFCLDRLLPCAASRSPDLLLIEFSVNDYLPDDDTSSFDPAVNIERLVRQVLQNFSHTAVIFTHFAFAPFLAMNNAEPMYAKVASLYHVPEISFRRWSADFLYQREHYAPTEGWVQTPDSKLRLLPNRIPLPIPEYFAERGLNFSQALYADCYHMNDRGHQLMASLVNQQLLGYVEHLKASAWTSMVDPLLVFSDPASRALPVFLDRPVASLPPVLSPFLATADIASFHCSVLYSPYNPNAHAMTQLQAESFLRVVDNGGWQYGSVSGSKKFAMQLPVREWPRMGQLLTVELLTPVHSLVMAFVRSWNQSRMGDADAWLSCKRESQWKVHHSTPKQRLQGTWQERHTQADSLQIWPLVEMENGTRLAGKSSQCHLRWLHLQHVSHGDVQLIGYMFN